MSGKEGAATPKIKSARNQVSKVSQATLPPRQKRDKTSDHLDNYKDGADVSCTGLTEKASGGKIAKKKGGKKPWAQLLRSHQCGKR